MNAREMLEECLALGFTIDGAYRGRTPCGPTLADSYNAFKYATKAQFFEDFGGTRFLFLSEDLPADKVRALWAVGITPVYKTLSEQLERMGKTVPWLGHWVVWGCDDAGEHTEHARLNDVFRGVHDFRGHAGRSENPDDWFGFGWQGELMAWERHARDYPREAHLALANETIAQQIWFHFGPHVVDKMVEGEGLPIGDDEAKPWENPLQWVTDAQGHYPARQRPYAPPCGLPVQTLERVIRVSESLVAWLHGLQDGRLWDEAVRVYPEKQKGQVEAMYLPPEATRKANALREARLKAIDRELQGWSGGGAGQVIP